RVLVRSLSADPAGLAPMEPDRISAKTAVRLDLDQVSLETEDQAPQTNKVIILGAQRVVHDHAVTRLQSHSRPPGRARRCCSTALLRSGRLSGWTPSHRYR